jgi:hypothetical protein
MDLFAVGKIPMYCEGIAHRIERRREMDTKIVDLSLKIEPFTSQLAAALDQDEYGFVKRTLFKLTDASPNVDLRAVEFRPPSDRQNLLCFATPDTAEASIALIQAKVTKIRARCSKDAAGWVLYVNVSFGPLSKTELEYVNSFYTEQRWVSWQESEPSLEFEDEDDGDDEQLDGGGRPAPMFDDDGNETLPPAIAVAEEHNRGLDSARPVPKRRASKPRQKVDHAAERQSQKSEGAKRAKKGARA